MASSMNNLTGQSFSDKLGLWLSFAKFFLGSFTIGIISLLFNHYLNEREIAIKEQQHLSTFVDKALEENIGTRYRLAVYFSNVSQSSSMKSGWESYLKVVEKEYNDRLSEKDKILEQLEVAMKSEKQNIEKIAELQGALAEAKEELSVRIKKQAFSDPAEAILEVRNGGYGMPTIGFGHTESITPESYPFGITEFQAIELFLKDIASARETVDNLVEVTLNKNQRDALTLFVWSVGKRAFQDSTLRKLLNAGEYGSVPEQLARWTRAGGKEIKYLVRRRAREAQLWNTPVQPQ